MSAAVELACPLLAGAGTTLAFSTTPAVVATLMRGVNFGAAVEKFDFGIPLLRLLLRLLLLLPKLTNEFALLLLPLVLDCDVIVGIGDTKGAA